MSAKENKRLMIFIDGSNLYHASKRASSDFMVDYVKLIEKLKDGRDLIRTYFYFAASALSGLVSLGLGRFGECLPSRSHEVNEQDDYDQMVIRAYRLANAMMEARDK